MEQSEVIRRIREYHIIKQILSSKSVKRLIDSKDPKVAGVLAVYQSYAEFFGSIKIDSFENFDKFFRRLENNYLASGTNKKVQPNEEGYREYIRSVLGKEGLKIMVKVLSDEEISKRINTLSTDIGGKTRESNAIIVARNIADYSVVSGLRGNLSESQRKGADLEAQLDRTRQILKLTKENAATKEAVLDAISVVEANILASIAEKISDNQYLMKAIAKSTGKKINNLEEELKNVIKKASDESKNRDAAISADISTGFSGVYSRIDALGASIDASTSKKTKLKIALAATGGALAGTGITTLMFLLLSNPSQPATVPNTPGTAVDTSVYTTYIADVDTLLGDFKVMVEDNIFTQAEKDDFMGDIGAFSKKYENTQFAESSKKDADYLTNMATSVFGMSEEKIEAVKKVAELEGNITNLNNTINGLNTKNAELQATIDGYKKEVEKLNKEINELKTKLENAYTEEEVQALNVKITGLEGRVKELEGNVETLKKSNAELTTENTNLKNENSELTTENANLKNEIAELKTTNANIQSELTDTKNLLTTANNKVAELEGLVKQGAIDKAALEKTNAELRTQIEGLLGNIAELNTKLTKAAEDYQALETLYNAQGEENTTLKAELETAKNQILALEEELNSLSVASAQLVFDIYECMTGSKTTDIDLAMATVAEKLGITQTTPSTGESEMGPQPEK